MAQQTQTASAVQQLTAVELVQSLFAAFGRGDIQYILDHVTEDCQWHAPGKGFVPIGGEYRGPQGVKRFFESLVASEQITEFEPREYFANGNDVVALGVEAMVSVKSGMRARGNWTMLFRTRDGKVTYWEQFFDTALYAAAHKEGV